MLRNPPQGLIPFVGSTESTVETRPLVVSGVLPRGASYTLGTRMSEITGQTTSVSNYEITSKIDVSGVTSVYFSSGGFNADTRIVFFTSANVYISGSKVAANAQSQYITTLTVPATAKYVQFCFATANQGVVNINYLTTTSEQRIAIAELDLNPRLSMTGKKIACFGDSIFGMYQDGYNSVTDNIREVTGATVYNFGFGGCKMSSHSDANYDKFSMYKLAEAIVAGSFTDQTAAAAAAGMPTYFPTTVTALAAVDFTDVDYVTIAYGTNDFADSKAINNDLDRVDTAAFCGALRYSLEALLGAYPHLKIVIISPTWRFWYATATNPYTLDSDSDTYTNSLNKTLVEYNTALKGVSDEYHLPYIDNYNCGINKYNYWNYFTPSDGTHHDTRGRTLLGRRIGRQIISMY